MNRRELLRSIPGLALIPIAGHQAYKLESGPQYLFVVNGRECNIEGLVETLSGMGIRGAVVPAWEDVEDFCRIYKLEE